MPPVPQPLLSTPRAAYVRLFLGAVLISFSGVWVKLSHVTPTVSAFYRVLIGGLVLVALAGMRGELVWKGARYLFYGIGCSIIFAMDLVLYHYSVQLIGPGLGTIIPNFQVFVLALVGILFFKEKLTAMLVLSMPVAFGGLFMIVGIDWGSLTGDYRTGILCGLGAALCYSGFLLLLRKMQAEQTGTSLFSVLMMVSLITTVFLGGEVLRTGDSFVIPDLQSLLSLTALGIFSQCVGWILITTALPRLRASLSGLILLLQPALSFVWDVSFFNRPTDMWNWLGVAVTLAAIYAGATSRARSVS